MPHIIVIDDDSAIRRLISASLQICGYTVEESADGVEALALMKSTKFDLIISDMNMPNMTGWELIRQLKSDPQTSEIPVVVLSAQNTSEDYDEAYKAGCSAFIGKPVDIPSFLEKIGEILDI
jgi:two-component system chemotaxis response regulator CheY